MNELEQKISAWRARMSAALPGREETLRELESHLRDQIAALCRTGVAADEAFSRSVQRLGEGQGLAREFDRVGARWWPASWVLRGVLLMLGAGGVALLVAIAAEFSARRMTPLLGVHVFLITSGFCRYSARA